MPLIKNQAFFKKPRLSLTSWRRITFLENWLTNRINARRSIIHFQRNVHRNFGGLFGMIDL